MSYFYCSTSCSWRKTALECPFQQCAGFADPRVLETWLRSPCGAMELERPSCISDEMVLKLRQRLTHVAYRQMGELAEDLVQESLFLFFT